MKKSFLLLLSLYGLCLLSACGGGSGGGSTTPPPPAATHFSVTAPAAATTGSAFSFTVSALGASNSAVTSYSGTVHFTSTDGQAVLPGNSTLTNGTGTFSATLKTLASQTITATDTVTASTTGSSNSITVNTPAATHFSVSAPASATAGVAFNIAVTALDASNNTATGYSGAVQFTSTDAQAVLPGNSTLTSGAGTFSATLKTVGSQTIAATDTVTASITGISNSINVSAPASLAITSGAPPSGEAGKLYDDHGIACLRGGMICTDLNGFVLSGSGGIAPYTWSWLAGSGSSLPPGLSVAFGPVGLLGDRSFVDGIRIAGTPTAAGSFDVVVTLTDSETPAMKASASYTILINPPPPPVISTMPLPAVGTLNSPYNFTFTVASGGLAPFQWSETGALPPGLSLSTGGVLSGTPTATGSFPITVQVRDSLGQQSAPQDFTIQVSLHGFKATGSMETARIGHTATLLSNGTVLVAGGFSSAGGLATAELFDPNSGTFAPTGSMQSGRFDHTATLLTQSLANGGKVLVAGGGTATAELFDPASGTFTPTGSMQTVRTVQTATLLNDGKVLVTGGGDADLNPLASAELFDPSSGTFTPTGSMGMARYGHTATLLKDGKVLVTGGLGANQNSMVTAELYDPSTGTFTPTGSMGMARYTHTATLLTDNKVLVTGGFDSNFKALATAELFDRASGTFTPTGSMETARSFHAATLLNDGTVLVMGGEDANGGNSLSSAEVFNSVSGTFTPTGSMGTPRFGPASTLLQNGTVLVTGGEGLATAELFQ